MGDGDKTILVTGATGRQGGAAIRHLLLNGWKLRALTRNPNGYAAKQLSERGVEVVQGDLEDPGSLERAAHGVYGIFSVQDYWVAGFRREVQQGKNLADIAKKTSVAHFVYSSAGGAERNTGIAPWETKWEIEKHIRKLAARGRSEISQAAMRARVGHNAMTNSPTLQHKVADSRSPGL